MSNDHRNHNEFKPPGDTQKKGGGSIQLRSILKSPFTLAKNAWEARHESPNHVTWDLGVGLLGLIQKIGNWFMQEEQRWLALLFFIAQIIVGIAIATMI